MKEWGLLDTFEYRNLQVLYEGRANVFPKLENVFRAFRECSYHEVKTVLMFQDPYFSKHIATGIATAVESKVVPFTLRNMLFEIERSFEKPALINPDLISWCRQGALLLNTSLTVEEDCPGSHYLVWNKWTTKFVTALSKDKRLVWALFGKKAQTYAPYINGLVHKIPHPAADAYGEAKFYGCNIFKKISDDTGIDWYK